MELIRCVDNFGDTVEIPKEKFFIRPSVYAIFLKNEHALTCLNRSSGRLWFPGGGINKGETHEEALRRECIEETGMKNIDIHRPVLEFQRYFYYAPTDEAMDARLTFYLCTSNDEYYRDNALIHDREAFDFAWRPIASLKPNMLSGEEEGSAKIIHMLHALCANK